MNRKISSLKMEGINLLTILQTLVFVRVPLMTLTNNSNSSGNNNDNDNSKII